MMHLTFRSLFLYSLLLSLLFAPDFALGDPPAEDESLRDYVSRNEGRFACGIYLGDNKAGWGVMESRLEDENGEEVLVVESEFHLAIRLLGQELKSRFLEKCVYELTGDGLLIRVEGTDEEDDSLSTQTAVRQEDKMLITTVKEGVTSQRTAPLPKDTIAQMIRLERWLSGPPKKGETFEEYTVDFDQPDRVDMKTVLRFFERRQVRWGGAPMMVNEVEATMYGVTIKASILDDGNLLKGKMGPFEIRLEEEAIAKNFKVSGFDMLFRVPVDRELGHPKKVQALTLKCVTDFAFPQSHRQRMQKEGDSVILKLTRNGPVDQAQPLSEADQKKYTQTTPSLQCDHRKIRTRAAKVAGKETDPVEVAGRLQKWIYDNLDRTYNKNAVTALRVLKNRAGDCTESALLFVSLARSLGIPARQVTGIMFADDDEPYFAWHAWAEIHDGKQWLSVDPAWDEVRVDATHIKLGDRQDDFGWISAVGNLKFQVVDVEFQDE